MKIMLSCIHTHLGLEQLAALNELISKAVPDWPYLIEVAQRHGVVPLVYHQLKQCCPQLIPPPVLQQLQSQFQSNGVRNLKLTGELVRFAKIFEGQQIPLMAFKGPTLARLAYGNIALRQFLDLDIIVPETDIAKAIQLLEEQGYTPAYKLSPVQLEIFRKNGYELPFWNANREISVDLHWSLLPRRFSFSPASDLVWQHQGQVSLGHTGNITSLTNIPSFSPELLLVFLCAHGAKHNWAYLSWLADVAELINSQAALDWEQAIVLAGQLGTRRMFFLGVGLAHEVLRVEPPARIRAYLEADEKLKALRTEAILGLLSDPIEDKKGEGEQARNEKTQTLSSLKTFFVMGDLLATYIKRFEDWRRRDKIYLSSMESLRDRLWYWVDGLFTPAPVDWTVIQLPRALFAVYYPIRVVRRTLKYILHRY